MLLTIRSIKYQCRKLGSLYLFFVFFLQCGLSAYAADITLSWDVNPDADYYIVYWGTVAGEPIDNSGSIGNKTIWQKTFPDDTPYHFAVKAFNSCGNSSDYSNWVASLSENKAPVANAGESQSVKEGDLVTLDGSGSKDSDYGDSIVSYQWTQTQGINVTLSDPSNLQTRFTAPDVGASGEELIFLLTVADKAGLQASDTCSVTVAAKAPTTGLTLSWDANPDADYYIVYWGTVAGEPIDNSGNIGNVTSWLIPFSDADKYYFAVKAYNSCGNASDYSLWVSSSLPDNKAPVANAGGSQSVKEGDLVTLDGSGSKDSDAGDSIVSYQWTQTGGPVVTLSDSTIVRPSFTAPDVGTSEEELTFLLTVADKAGLQATDTSMVTVAAKAPTTGFTLSWDANPDADYYIVYWGTVAGEPIDNSGNIGNVTSWSTNLPDAAKYYFAVKAYNSCGNASDYSLWVSSSALPDNKAPLADAGTAQTVGEGDLVTLDGSASSDPDSGDGIASYQWTQTEGISVRLSDPTLVRPMFTAPDVDQSGALLTFLLTVADKNGLQATASCRVTVIKGVVPPERGEIDDFQPVTLSNIVTVSDNYPSMEVFNKNFEHLEWLKTGWQEYNDFSGVAHVATGDINGNGETEIIIGLARVKSQSSMPGGFFEIIDKDYNHLAWGRVQWSEYNSINGETWPACGDIDGDGVDEIVIGFGVGGKGYFEVFKYIEDEPVHSVWAQIDWPEYETRIGETRAVCADIDGDGADEIIVGLGSRGGTDEMPAGLFEVFDNDLTHLLWGGLDWLEYNEANGETWPAPGDIDGDGDVELVVGLGVGGQGRMKIFEFEASTLAESQWVTAEWPEYNEVSGETRPVCGDIDDDQKDEIILGLGPVNNEPDIPDGFILVIDDDFTLMAWEQINHPEFNKLNGESIPAKGPINEADNIIISLGSWEPEEDDGTFPIDIPDVCFINSSGRY